MLLRLKELRERRLLTQQDLAASAGLTIGTINRLERGVHQPRFATIHRLANVLQVDPHDLVVWDAYPESDARGQ